jgi:hypothetical protein
VAEDDPNPEEEQSNSAHCEVRVKPQGSKFTPNYKINDKTVKAEAQNRLARKLKIHTPPK